MKAIGGLSKAGLVVIAASLLLVCLSATRALAISTRVQAHYYVWYLAPYHDGAYEHWGGNMHYPEDDDLAAMYYPELDLYSASDGAIMRQHMKQFADAGIGVVIADWWGQQSHEDFLARQILDIANEYDLKVAWHIEAYGGRTAQSAKNDVIYLIDKHGSHPAFYRDSGMGNRPLFYVWAPGGISDSDWATAWDSIRGTSYNSIVMACNLNHTSVLNGHWDGFYAYIGGDDSSNWMWHASWAQSNGKLFAPPVGPGYDFRAIGRPELYQPRGDGAFYDSVWSLAKSCADSYSSVRYVPITSYNEWHEGHQIEPAIDKWHPGRTYEDYGGVPSLYVDKTTSWAAVLDPSANALIQCEDYSGGTSAQEGVDYHDTTSGNAGGQYRTQDVDITTCVEGGYYVGWTVAGEWLRYTSVQVSGSSQQIRLRAASGSGPKNVRVCDGSLSNTILTLTVPDTGGNEQWRTVGGTVSMSAGSHTLYLVIDHSGVNLNWFDVRAITDKTPPSPPSNLAAASGDGQMALSWTNPSSDFMGTTIRCATDHVPLSCNDGTLVCTKYALPGSNDSFVHTGLGNGTIYYYSAFAFDGTPNYSYAVHTFNAPASTYCYSDTFPYADGALNGNGGWSGSATASHIEVVSQMVRMWGGSGSYDSLKTVSCGDPGSGYRYVRCRIYRGEGSNTMWNLWINDTAGKNLARWYGSGTTARGRIGTTSSVTATQTLTGGWDDIDVKINFAADTSEFFFNGTSIGTLSHSSQGAGDVIGQLRFERENNSAASGEHVYLDTIRVGESVADTTAPGPVSSFGAVSTTRSVVLLWANPADADYIGTMIRYKTTGYPTSPTDGALLCSCRYTDWELADLTSYTTTYYFTAWAYDEAGNYSTPSYSSAIPYYLRETFPYTAGGLATMGIWTGSATGTEVEITTDGRVKINGGAGMKDAVRGVYCGDIGTGLAWVRCKAMGCAGGRTIWSLWINDPDGKNLGRWYGTGWSARGRIGNTSDVTPQQTLTGGWDTIDVAFDFGADTSAFYFNGSWIGTLSHASQGAGNAIGQLRFERIDNWEAVGHCVYLDDLRVGP